jgi:PRTRC genetic system protein B
VPAAPDGEEAGEETMKKKSALNFTTDTQTWMMSLHFFDESIYLQAADHKTGETKEYEVSAADIARRMDGRSKLSTGLMSLNVIFYANLGDGDRVIHYIPPAVRELQVRRGKSVKRYQVPLPPMVLWYEGGYRIAALMNDAITPKTQLATPPLPNVHEGGKICTGSVKFPRCSMAAFAQVERLLWESEWNHHLADGKCRSERKNVIRLWKKLQGKKTFPEKELCASRYTLGDLAGRLSDDIGERES